MYHMFQDGAEPILLITHSFTDLITLGFASSNFQPVSSMRLTCIQELARPIIVAYCMPLRSG